MPRDLAFKYMYCMVWEKTWPNLLTSILKKNVDREIRKVNFFILILKYI